VLQNSGLGRTVRLLILAMAAGATLPSFAQHTEVEKNGTGRIENDYNVEGKVVEMRTLDANGKVQQKVNYQYLPGYYGAQQTDTTYWPNGKLRRLTHTSYDASANFTGESVQLFDDSGKQIGGHKLRHDPWRGIYRCSEWNADAQDYRPIACPAGEEEGGGGAEEAKKFTYEDVRHNLEGARKAATQERASEQTLGKELELILPAHVRPGERVSGTIADNPSQYDENPEVSVTRIAVPPGIAAASARLSAWVLEVAGEKPQLADRPITFIVPRRGPSTVTLRAVDDPTQSMSVAVSFAQTKEHRPKSFHASAFCLKGGLCAVAGPFNGDSSKTFAAFEQRPAVIVAESTHAAYIRVPELTAPGAHPLFIAEGSKLIAFPITVGEFLLKNNHRDLKAGDKMILIPTIDGASDIPDTLWRTGNFPEGNLELARKLIPGFKLPRGSSEEKEELEKQKNKAKEDKSGALLMVIRNQTPDHMSLHDSSSEMLVFHLNHESFSRGEFKYNVLVECTKSGKVGVQGYVIPFLSPVEAQEFEANSSAH